MSVEHTNTHGGNGDGLGIRPDSCLFRTGRFSALPAALLVSAATSLVLWVGLKAFHSFNLRCLVAFGQIVLLNSPHTDMADIYELLAMGKAFELLLHGFSVHFSVWK